MLMNFSATENLMMKALAMGVIRPKEQVAELLHLVGLEQLAPRKVKKFSTGHEAAPGVGACPGGVA